MSISFKSLLSLSQHLSILYVEDDDILREQTEITFSNLFKHIDTAIDGEDGLQKYQLYHKSNSKYYDIVITDIQMPKLNGIELCKEILFLHKEQNIIIMSAYEDSDYLLELKDMGIEAFLQKPMTGTKMLEVLFHACESIQ